MPFGVVVTKLDHPELIVVDVEKQDNNAYLVTATLRAPEEPRTLQGAISISTDLPAQPVVILPFHARIE